MQKIKFCPWKKIGFNCIIRSFDFHQRFKEFWHKCFSFQILKISKLNELINKPIWTRLRTHSSQLMTNLMWKAKCKGTEAIRERPAVWPDTKYQNKQRLAQLYVSLKKTRIWTTQQGKSGWSQQLRLQPPRPHSTHENNKIFLLFQHDAVIQIHKFTPSHAPTTIIQQKEATVSIVWFGTMHRPHAEHIGQLCKFSFCS